MRMTAFRAGSLGVRRVEVRAAVLAMMTHGKHIHEQASTFRHGAAGYVSEDTVQASQGEAAPPADRQVNAQNSTRRDAVGRLVYDRQNVIREFPTVHLLNSRTCDVTY